MKTNDLTDNIDIRHLHDLSDKDVVRLKKYLKAYKRLTDDLCTPSIAKEANATSTTGVRE